MNRKQELLKEIPQVDELLKEKPFVELLEELPRSLVLESIREILGGVRKKILEMPDQSDLPPKEELIDSILRSVKQKNSRHLVKTINATGVVLHTNLGRACLSERSCAHVLETARTYSNLEYDLEKGCRGSRHDHVSTLICEITGAEAAMLVNNNAAATILCLATIAKDKEVVVSRGELVEIGGSFRITEIMEQSGAILKETGTTNKTKLKDYEKAIHPENTAALMKVHTSNFRIVGFTEEVSLAEMTAMGKEHQLPVIYDMGNGLLIDLNAYGIDEPTVMDAVKTGVDIILFSGDKLLGGPQGGVIIGKKIWIDQMKKHPLARAFRVDKMTLAAMESTFYEYLDEKKALANIPTLSMLTLKQDELRVRAEALRKAILAATSDYEIELEADEDQVGGGAAPLARLKGYSLVLSCGFLSATELERALRKVLPPIIGRLAQDKIRFSLRTILPEEEPVIVQTLLSLQEGVRR